MESQKANDPSVKSPLVEKLQEQFMNLQQDWESYKQTNPNTKRRSYSTNSSSSNTMAKTLDQLLDNSPRHLMSSLQQRMHPSEGDNWNVNDLAVEEIRRDRREAIESGKLKGRRLFEEAEHEETDIGFGGEEAEWGGWDQESEERSVPFRESDGEEAESGKSKEIKVCFQLSASCSISSPSGEKMEEEEEKSVSVVEKEIVKNKAGNWVRCIVVIMPVLAIIFAICSIRVLYGYGNENYEAILVPT